MRSPRSRAALLAFALVAGASVAVAGAPHDAPPLAPDALAATVQDPSEDEPQDERVDEPVSAVPA